MAPNKQLTLKNKIKDKQPTAEERQSIVPRRTAKAIASTKRRASTPHCIGMFLLPCWRNVTTEMGGMDCRMSKNGKTAPGNKCGHGLTVNQPFQKLEVTSTARNARKQGNLSNLPHFRRRCHSSKVSGADAAQFRCLQMVLSANASYTQELSGNLFSNCTHISYKKVIVSE